MILVCCFESSFHLLFLLQTKVYVGTNKKERRHTCQTSLNSTTARSASRGGLPWSLVLVMDWDERE